MPQESALIGMLGLRQYNDKTVAVIHTAQETIYKALLAFLTFTALLWMSIFLYATFYYTYLPAVSHVRSVHLQYSMCGIGGAQTLCSFPSANVTLTHKEQFLTVGQPYKIALELDMPESPANQQLGMFMTCAHLKNKDGDVISRSCRSAMMCYKSSLLHAILTFVFSPFLISGSLEEKQRVEIELFSNFQEQRMSPATNAFIEIQSHKIEIYRSTLRIVAHFTGLRFIMFHWPFLSAVIGVLVNLFFLTIITCLSWYKYFQPKQPVYQVVGYDENKAKALEEHRRQPEPEIIETKSGVPEFFKRPKTSTMTKEDLDIPIKLEPDYEKLSEDEDFPVKPDPDDPGPSSELEPSDTLKDKDI